MRMHCYRAHALCGELVVLVLHQGDERTYDYGKSWKQHRRQLVDERLATARRHHDKCVLPRENGGSRFPLARAKIAMAKPLVKQQQGCFLRYTFWHHPATGTNYSRSRTAPTA